VYAICWAFLLVLVQPGEMSNLLVLTVPGYLLIGNFTGHILGKIPRGHDIAVMLIVLLAGGVVVANVVRYGRLAAFESSQTGTYHLLLALTAIVLAIIAITMIWSWSEHSVTMGVTAGLLLLFKSTIDNPSLRWHLREMVDFEIVSTLPKTDFSQALITPMSQIPPLTNDYIGMDFSFLRTETSHILEAQQALTWWLFRESPVPINEERVILWLRADLVGGSS